MAKVTFTVSKTGEIEMEISGVKGGGCSDIRAKITEALDMKVEDDSPTEEFYQCEDAKINEFA